MNMEIEETGEMVVEEGAGGGSHHKEAVAALVDMQRNGNVASKESVGEAGNQEKDKLNVELYKEDFTASVDMQGNEERLATEEADSEMIVVSNDVIREKSVMGSEHAKYLDSPTNAITVNEKDEVLNVDTSTTKEVLLVPKKNVIKRKKVVQKRKLVKGEVTVAKDEEKPQSSDMLGPSVERIVDSKGSVGEAGNQEKDKLIVELDKEEFTAMVDMQNNEAGLAEGDGETSLVSEDVVREESVMGIQDAKDLESSADAITINEKDGILNDDINSKKEVLLAPKKKILKRKKVVKKRKPVKGEVTVAKDEEKPQLSDMPGPSAERILDSKKSVGEAGNQEKDKLNVELDKEEFTALVDTQNHEAGLASEEGDGEMFVVSEDVIREGSVMGSQHAKDLESPADAITVNEKDKILNDNINSKNEVSFVPKKKILKRKKVVKKRKLVKGKVSVAKDEEKPQSSGMPDPSVEVKTYQDLKNEENNDGKSMEKINSSVPRTKKKNAQHITDMAVKPKRNEKNKKDGKEKTASESENVDDLKEEAKCKSKVKLSKITSRKAEMGTSDKVAAEDKAGAGPSEKRKSSTKVQTRGMIFMCSSKTKEDCYRYKILGLPAGKKDIVSKIYKGMRLFLFDLELKLLYGIYKAAASGGYNIEPNAFKSNFPSQVRFTTVHDCSPLPEEKFKKVIKDNYYTKNKFNCELNSKQVKSLCKLFLVANKGSKSKAQAVTERPKVGISSIIEREKKRRVKVENDNRGRETRAAVDSERDIKRRRVVDDVKHSRSRGDVRSSRDKGNVRRPRAKGDVVHSRAEDHARRLRFEDDARRLRLEDARRLRAEDDARRLRLEDEERRLHIQDEERRLRIEDDARRLRADDRRHSPLTLNDNRYRHRADAYERETYVPSALTAPLHLDPLPPPALPPYTSSYTGRASLFNDYRLDRAIKNEDRGLAYSRSRHPYEYQSPYLQHREPVVYRDPGYDVSSRPSYYSTTLSRDEYLPSTSRTSRYGLPPYRY